MSDAIDIDLDALQAQRTEAVPHRTIRFKRKTFKIAPEFLWSWHEAFETKKADAVVRAVLGDSEFERFVKLDPSDEDFKALAIQIAVLFGYDPGEAPASNGSSPTNGGRSRRTSGASTASTSAKRSGVAAKP